jgi:hypothetical protein
VMFDCDFSPNDTFNPVDDAVMNSASLNFIRDEEAFALVVAKERMPMVERSVKREVEDAKMPLFAHSGDVVAAVRREKLFSKVKSDAPPEPPVIHVPFTA